MKSAIGNSWRNAAALVAVCGGRAKCNYEVLLQTRPQGGSFRNSVVFPGGVSTAADASADWLRLLATFGYSQPDFDALHCAGTPLPPILQHNPVLRHIELRITAIRETFEELGFLVCSRQHKTERSGVFSSHITDFDVKYWQERISKNPEDLLTLCTELGCYPDIWSLYYWSNWLTPAYAKKRFDTAFFLTALKSKPDIRANSEVVNAEWQTPQEVLTRSKDLVLYPPQIYELILVSRWAHAQDLATFARAHSARAEPLVYHATVFAADGVLAVLPGDELYPESVDYNVQTNIKSDKTVEQLRDSSRVAHRIEVTDSKSYLVFKNFKPKNQDMGDRVIEINVTFS